MNSLELVARARPIVEAAGQLALAIRAEGLETVSKDDGTPVTNADKAVSAFLMRELRAAFPDTKVISEEHPDLSGVDHPLTWAIDPIDGTKKFCAGKPVWSIMIGLFDTAPLASIIYFPEGSIWYYAERGKGAFMEDAAGVHRLRIAEPARPLRLVHAPGFAVPIGERGTYGFMKWTRKLIWHRIDGYVRDEIGYWDLVPPMLLALEAGALVVDLAGHPIALTSPEAVQPGCILGHPVAVHDILTRIRNR